MLTKEELEALDEGDVGGEEGPENSDGVIP